MMNWALDHSYSFRGETVRYAVWGSGPPIVLVHGTPFSSFVWHRIAPYLAEDYQVFCFDLLGYGQSEKRNEQDVSLGVQNMVLAELLDHWRIDEPDIVAHDFGGATALRAHLLNGRKFQSMTLIDPVAVAPWGIPFDRHVRAHQSAFLGLPADMHEALVRTYVRGAVKRAMPENELIPYIQPWLGDVGQAAFYRQIAQFDQCYTDEIEPRYGEISCPVLILWGEDDEWLPIERGRWLTKLIPSASLRPVSHSGHLVQEDAPEAVIAAVTGFLRRS